MRATIVIPCYNEAERLDLLAFRRFLRQHAEVDFLFVDDGSVDATASRLEDLHQAEPSRVRCLKLRENQGKAEAVRWGVCLAMGLRRDSADEMTVTLSGAYAADPPDLVGFWDADLATPLEAIDQFRRVMVRRPGVQLVIGSRMPLLGREIVRDPKRAWLGRGFAQVASRVLGLPVRDTQCGAKLFRVNELTRRMWAEPFGTRWIFDVELLARMTLLLRENGEAAEMAGSVYELPLDEWRDVAGSKLRQSDFVRAVGELLAIWRRYRWGGVYQPQYELAVPRERARPLRAAG